MDYVIALYKVHTSGDNSDLVKCGLTGFKPFETRFPESETVDLNIRFGEKLSFADYSSFDRMYEFQFEDEYAECSFGRYDNGYLFVMTKSEQRMLFVKADGSNIVLCNMGNGADVDATLLRFGLWIMFGITIAPLGAIAIHSSVIVKNNVAALFLGESGTGKSTHTRLWRENIQGAKLLNDDSPIIRIVDGVPTVFGSPWSGKTPCYHNIGFPIKGFVRLSQAPYNAIKRLGILNAIGALLPSCPPAFAHDDNLQDCICDTLSKMIDNVPTYHLECLPNSDAAQLSYNTLFDE